MLSWSQSWAKAKVYPKPKLIQSQSWSKSKHKPKPKVSQSHGYGYNWYWHGCRPPTGFSLFMFGIKGENLHVNSLFLLLLHFSKVTITDIPETMSSFNWKKKFILFEVVHPIWDFYLYFKTSKVHTKCANNANAHYRVK